MERKTFLQSAAAVMSSSFFPVLCLAENTSKKSLRFAHLTDIHLRPGLIPEAGTAKAFHHVQQLKSKVDFIINGGDSIFDSLETDKQQTQIQWDLFHKVLKNENSLPIYHCIGNHDVWGWFIKEGKPENDRQYGKVWVVESLKNEKQVL